MALARSHFVEAGAPDALLDHVVGAGLSWANLLKLLMAYGPALWGLIQVAVNSGWDLKAILAALLAAIGSGGLPTIPPVPTEFPSP